MVEMRGGGGDVEAFYVCDFLHIVQSRSTVPRGLTYKCISVKFTPKLAIFKCICDCFGEI
jgi:hypothetical protein